MPAQLFVDSEEENDDFEDGNISDEDEEDDDNGVDDNANGGGEESEDGKKKRKLNKAKRSKKTKKLGPKHDKGVKDRDKLTANEIKELTAKEYAQYSSLYNVQIEEVLEETKISSKRQNEVMGWIESFKKFVMEQVKKSKPFLIQDHQKMLGSVKLPLPGRILKEDFPGLMNQSTKWRRPVNVEIHGAWAVGTALNKVSFVDVFLEMPEEYLNKSDYSNHKYHIKRAIYLGFLAKKLKKRGDQVTFALENGERLKPVLCVEVDKVQVLIHAIPPENFFNMKKLACDKNGLRFENFFNKKLSKDEPDSSTQNYNTTILQDCLARQVHEEVTTFLEGKQNYQDAIKLIKIWLTQRGLAQGYGAFSGCIVTQFIRYLHKMGKISENVTAFQLVRVFFVSLIQTDLIENGISFNDDGDTKLAHNQFDTVFLDSTGLLNYTFNLSKFTYKRLQFEAKRALLIIDGGNVSGFMALFITPVKFTMTMFSKMDKFIACVHKKRENETLILNHSGFIYPVVVSTVGSLIETCLGKRMELLDSELPACNNWELESPMPKHVSLVIRFGLNINRELSQRGIEKCESESEYEIEQFKQFWGNKSQLRRFKDGSLLESVVIDNLWGLGKARLCYQMLCFILKKHLHYELTKDEYLDRQIESLIENKYLRIKPSSSKQAPPTKKVYLHGKLQRKRKLSDAKEELQPVSVDDITRRVSTSFDELSKILRMLEELPLAISTVQGTSSVLRFSHIQPTPPQLVFQTKDLTDTDSKRRTVLLAESAKNKKDDAVAALPDKVPKYVEPVGVIIHLETSGQWPDDIKAIDRLKCAFLINIGELLTKKFALTVQPYARHLDVLKDGFVFRIRITYFRELTLLRELRGSDGVLRVRDNAESLRLEKEALILPQLTSTLHSFHLQYEAFGKTCRIAKRWVASQLLLSSPMEYNRNLEEPDCRLAEEAVELLVANLFINYALHLSFPNEAQVGFQRFLYMLGNTDFRAILVVVNFNDKLSYKEVSAIELEFVKIRSTLPPLFLATPFDQKGSVWTKSLSPIILARLQLLAKQALSVLDKHFNCSLLTESELLKIFRPSTTQFDIIIRLKRQINPRLYQSLESLSAPVKFQEYRKEMDEVIPVVDFDPVQMFLQDLRNAFGHMAIFLHDLYGGQYIAVVWKPHIFKGTAFTATGVKGRQLAKDGESIIANVNGAVESFQEMGSGIIHNIEAHSDRWKFED